MNGMRARILTIILCLLITATVSAEEEIKGTSFFNQSWLETLVSIEFSVDGKTGTPTGSGFLIQTPGNHIALITAKHVIFDENENQHNNLAYRINRKQGKSDLITEIQMVKYAPGGWLKSSDYDVACRLITWGDKSEFCFIPYSQLLTKHRIEPGAPLFVIGFPMGLRSEEYATPILRKGIVARTDPNNILIDAFVFPGNSGGPVVYAPLTPQWAKVSPLQYSRNHGSWDLSAVMFHMLTQLLVFRQNVRESLLKRTLAYATSFQRLQFSTCWKVKISWLLTQRGEKIRDK